MIEPILTIITRHMMNKRKIVFRRMLESIAGMKDIQHLIIEDNQEIGHKYISKLVIANREKVIGKYVGWIDDDDVCTCPQLPQLIQRIDEVHNPDLIMARSMIYHWGIFPKDEYWGKDISVYPIKAVSIMTPIAKRQLFIDAVPMIAGHTHQVDTAYFQGIQAIHRRTPLKVYYLNYIIGWQPLKLSTGSEIDIPKTEKYIQFGVKE